MQMSPIAVVAYANIAHHPCPVFNGNGERLRAGFGRDDASVAICLLYERIAMFDKTALISV